MKLVHKIYTYKLKETATAAAAAGVVLASSALPVFAQVQNPISVSTFGGFASLVFNAILAVVGVLALIFLAIGGIQYMTSGGDKFAVEAARGRITAALVGLLVVFGAWLLINVVGGILGVENILSPGF